MWKRTKSQDKSVAWGRVVDENQDSYTGLSGYQPSSMLAVISLSFLSSLSLVLVIQVQSFYSL